MKEKLADWPTMDQYMKNVEEVDQALLIEVAKVILDQDRMLTMICRKPEWLVNLADQIRVMLMMVLGKNSSDPDENTKIVTITNSILLILCNNGVITSSEYEELTQD